MSWIKRKIALWGFALANVEKNTLGQSGDSLGEDVNQVQRYRQGTLADDLLQGRLTEEVILLRARTHKINQAVDKLKSTAKPTFDDNGEFSGYDVTITNKKYVVKTKGDPFDDYKVSMVIDNSPITASVKDSLIPVDGNEISQERPITIGRSIHPRFEIEKYSEKLMVRDIDENKKLLEFYIQQYPNIYDKKTSMLVSLIKKTIENPKTSDLLDIETVNFVTDNSIGVKSNLEFQYNIINFDKIVKHNGYYVIKFLAKPIVNGVDIFEKYRNEELDEKYLNKEAKKLR